MKSSIFTEPKLSLQIAPLALSSVRSPQFTRFFHIYQFLIFVHYLRCKTETPAAADCHLRCARLCFLQMKSGECCMVVSLLAQPSPHDKWPCDHTQVVLCGITPTHTSESLHLEFIFLLGSFLRLRLVQRKPRPLMKPTRNELEYAVGPFRSQHVRLLFGLTCCLDKSEFETCLRFPVSENPQSKATIGVDLFLFPPLPTVSIRCCPTNSSTFDTSSTPISANSMS